MNEKDDTKHDLYDLYELKVGLVENDSSFREQVQGYLKQTLRVGGVFAWESAEICWRDKKSADLDIALLDIMLPGMSGVELAALLGERNPETRIVMLTNMNSDELIFDSLRNGAVGYVLKSELNNLGGVIETVAAGGAIITPTIALRVMNSFKATPPDDAVKLTNKESQILEQLVRGKSVAGVAEFLGITQSGVKFHVKNIYKKLNVHSRAEMVKKAGDMGLI